MTLTQFHAKRPAGHAVEGHYAEKKMLLVRAEGARWLER